MSYKVKLVETYILSILQQKIQTETIIDHEISSIFDLKKETCVLKLWTKTARWKSSSQTSSKNFDDTAANKAAMADDCS